MPGYGIAQGSLFVIFGTALNSSPSLVYASYPLPTTLSKTSVSVTVGSTTVSAYLIEVSAGYIAAILPSNTPIGTGTISVTFSGATSKTAPITVVASAFGALTANQAGTGPAVVFNASQTGQPVNSLLASAASGEIGVLWGTGLGALPGGGDNQPPTQTNAFGAQTQVFVGGVASPQVIYAGRSTFSGVDQINFVIPNGVQGCWVPVYVVINGIASNVTSMAITPGDGPCSDPTQLSASDVATFTPPLGAKNNTNIGGIGLTHLLVNFNLKALGGAISGPFDQFQGSFYKVPDTPAVDMAFFPGLIGPGNPSLGYCMAGEFVYDGTVTDAIGVGSNLNFPFQYNAQPAGSSLTLTGAAGTVNFPESPAGSGQYKAQVGGISTSGPATPAFFNPGTFTVSDPGDESVGKFTASITIPAIMTWTNEPTPGATISRSQNLVINWTGASATTEFVTIGGTSVNTTTNAGMDFICTAPSAPGTFTVPSAILSMLPASGLTNGDSVGFLLVGQVPLRSNDFLAPTTKLDIGYALYKEFLATNVVYQ